MPLCFLENPFSQPFYYQSTVPPPPCQAWLCQMLLCPVGHHSRPTLPSKFLPSHLAILEYPPYSSCVVLLSQVTQLLHYSLHGAIPYPTPFKLQRLQLKPTSKQISVEGHWESLPLWRQRLPSPLGPRDGPMMVLVFCGVRDKPSNSKMGSVSGCFSLPSVAQPRAGSSPGLLAATLPLLTAACPKGWHHQHLDQQP